MKNYFFFLFILINGPLYSQTIKLSSLTNSTLRYDSDIVMSNSITNKAILKDVTIEVSGELSIDNQEVYLDNSIIKCDKITFAASVKTIKLSRDVRINCKEIVFVTDPNDLTITASGTGSFLVNYAEDFSNKRKIVMKDIVNYKINFLNK